MNRAAAIAVMLAALWTTPGAAQAPGTDTDPRLERTWRAYRAGRFDEALAAARLASAALPSSGPALLAHGWMAEYLGEFDEAQSVYAKARTVASDDPDVLLRVASFSVRVGEYDDAVALLDRVLAGQPWWIRWAFLHGPTFAQAAVRRGNAVIERTVQLKLDVLMEKGQLAEARRVAREYRVVQPARDYCGEARQRGATGPREEIFLAFRLAALAQPDAADCIWWYGQWLTDEGFVRLGRVMVIEGTRVTPSAANKASGERYLRVRLSNGREVSKRVEQLALIGRQRYLRDGDTAGAVRLLMQASALDQGYPRSYNHLARIAWDEGDRAGAVAWLERGLQADPASWRTHRNLGRALALLGRDADAEAHLRKTVELFDDDSGGRLALARVLYARGKFAEYARETRRALQFAGNWGGRGLEDVSAFLATFERSGPGKSLPPAPDPAILIGWNYD